MSVQFGDDIVVEVTAEGKVNLEGSARTSGCVGGITFDRPVDSEVLNDSFTIEKDKLTELFHDFQKRSEIYNLTGCIHSAAISDGSYLITVAEDIGRHNAVDKAIGYCVLENISLRDKIILVSGRLSSEMAAKCAKWGIPIVASRAAPTALAIDIAGKRGITMIGFMRGSRMKIYTCHERIRR